MANIDPVSHSDSGAYPLHPSNEGTAIPEGARKLVLSSDGGSDSFDGKLAQHILDSNNKLVGSWRSSKEHITRNIKVKSKLEQVTYSSQVHTDLTRSKFTVDCSSETMTDLGEEISKAKNIWDLARKNTVFLGNQVNKSRNDNRETQYSYKRDAEEFLAAFREESNRISHLPSKQQAVPLAKLQAEMAKFANNEIQYKDILSIANESLKEQNTLFSESQNVETKVLETYRDLVISGLYTHALEESSHPESTFAEKPDELMSVLTQTLQQGSLATVLIETQAKLQSDLGLDFVTLTGQKSDGVFEINLSRDAKSHDLIGRLNSECSVNAKEMVYNKEFDDYDAVKRQIGKVSLQVFLNYTNNSVSYLVSGFTKTST